MRLPRDLSGTSFVKHLSKRWGYRQVHQVGSHIILETQQPRPHRIAVPSHSPLRIGTLNAILAAVAAHKNVTKEEILKDV
jgi:predicted RNA binding protein YcfA (HicA-like mRNA interferase family)